MRFRFPAAFAAGDTLYDIVKRQIIWTFAPEQSEANASFIVRATRRGTIDTHIPR